MRLLVKGSYFLLLLLPNSMDCRSPVLITYVNDSISLSVRLCKIQRVSRRATTTRRRDGELTASARYVALSFVEATKVNLTPVSMGTNVAKLRSRSYLCVKYIDARSRSLAAAAPSFAE